ncbi:retrovirus-related pol polyprotein from transposon TNT 1-94 [Tanacetum coccineum]
MIIRGQSNVDGVGKIVVTPVVQKSGIQCYNCKEYGHVSRECQKPKRVKDAAYHKEKMLLCKQEEAGVQLKKFRLKIKLTILGQSLMMRMHKQNGTSRTSQPMALLCLLVPREETPIDYDEANSHRCSAVSYTIHRLLTSLAAREIVSIYVDSGRVKFCDADLEVAFRKLHGYILGILKGNDMILTGFSWQQRFDSISLQDSQQTTTINLL